MKSRDKEIKIIRDANRAAAVGRLMLGEFDDWVDFFLPETEDLDYLPRRMLKSGKRSVRKDVSKNIKRFADRNFIGMDLPKLANLYESIKAQRGLEMPLSEFEKEVAKIKPSVIQGSPKHCTVIVSLWGLQFKFPEDMLSKDVLEGLLLNRTSEKFLSKYKGASHSNVKAERDEIAAAVKQSSFGARMCVLSCFNLVEAFVNGIAWDFSLDARNMEGLSKTKKTLIQDGSLREKILKYPEIITGKHLWSENDEPVKSFLEQVKPFRDSLVHPSPFSVKERYGGHDKLKHLYLIDSEKAEQSTKVTIELISIILRHTDGNEEIFPRWFQYLVDGVDGDGA